MMLLLVFTILFSTIPIPAQADGFTVLAAPYPPYSVSKGLSVTGPSVTALSAIMAECGSPLDKQAFKLTPWAFAYECAARKSGQILINAKRSPENERLYKWVGPVLNSRIVLIGRRENGPAIPLRSDLEEYRIATVRWSRPEKTLLEGGVAKDTLLRTPSHVTSLRMLARGEVDLFATNERGAARLLEGLGMAPEEFAVCHVFEEEPLYYAFSRDTDDALITRLNRALEQFKSRGGLKQNAPAALSMK